MTDALRKAKAAEKRAREALDNAMLTYVRQCRASDRASEGGEMKPITLWVVEMYNDFSGRYEPTVGAAITRESGRRELDQWREDNPADSFRLVPYVPKAVTK